MVPDAAVVIDALPAVAAEGADVARYRCIAKRRDHDQKGMAEQRDEGLAAQRMTFQHADDQRHLERLGGEDADDRPSSGAAVSTVASL